MPDQPRNRRAIDRWILERAPLGGRVLDIGCGEGELLALLVKERQVRGAGIELSESCVFKCVQRGLTVHHGDVDEGLDDYGDASFDLVLMSLTIQELGDPRRALREAFRVGKRVLLTFPNFAHWRARWQLGVLGRAPLTRSLPFTWFDSPNRHFLTVADWERFCPSEGWRPVDRAFLSAGKPIRLLPNFRAEVALYILEKTAAPVTPPVTPL